MEGSGIDDQRYRQASYGGVPVQHDVRRPLPPAGPVSHPPPQSNVAPAGSWPPHSASGPPPSSISSYERPLSAQAYPQHQPYGPYPPPPRGDYGAPSSAPPYARSADSLSTPRRSPVESGNLGHHQPMNGHLPEGPPGDYYPPSDYRARPTYPEVSPSSKQTQPHPLQVPGGGRETMQNPPSGPPPAPQSQSTAAPPPVQPPPVQYQSQAPPSHPVPAGPGNRISPVSYDSAQYWHMQQMNSQQPFPRPRGHRAQHACESCRTRKAKCDEGKPSCGHCLENHLGCHYRDQQPQKQEKAGQAQLELMTSMNTTLQLLLSDVQSMKEDMTSVKGLVKSHEDEMEIIRKQSIVAQMVPPLPVHASMQRTTSASHDPNLVKTEPKSFSDEVEAVQPTQEVKRSYGDGLVMSMDHTTAAHELLAWPSIKLLFKGSNLLPEKDYVQRGEWERGLLRLYGYGEGANKDEAVRAPASPAASAISSNSDELAGGSPDFVWGFDFESSGDVPILDDHPGGLTPEAKLKLDPELIDDYYQSFLVHMYTLHPIVDPRRVRAMLAKFKYLYSPSKAGGANLGKRKRDPEPRHRYPGDHNVMSRGGDKDYPPRYSKLERNIGNAFLLLLLALGKICAHRQPLPGPVRSHGTHSGSTSTPSSQPATFRSSSALSSMQNSPSMPLSTPGQAYSSAGHDPMPGSRNLDVIPGLAYYSWAVGVLGEHVGGSDLEHCQACLLAALYAGQLAHPCVSYGWIFQASLACIGLIKRHEKLMIIVNGAAEGSRAARERTFVDLIQTCFWTCLQLESDIRAELSQLPPSGITEFEGWMTDHLMYNTAHAIDATGTPYSAEEIRRYYVFQLHLRKELNRIHSEFYDPKKNGWTLQRCQDTLRGYEKYRSIFGETSAWTDDEAPATDILTARLRAKFYGGRNIIIRPFLEQIIKEENEIGSRRDAGKGQELASPSSAVTSAHSRSPAIPHPRNSAGITRQQHETKFQAHYAFSQNLRDADIPPLSPADLTLAEIGIKSLIQSTIAFDNVPGDRLIVTNSFGTFHAQFGNMIILAAAIQSPRLRQLVSRDEFNRLMTRTIRVLSDHREISPTLREDAIILENIRNRLPNSMEPAERYSSLDS